MTTNQANPKPTMSADDVARELGISRSNAYQIMHSTGFPSMRVGVKRIVCYRCDFEKWVADKLPRQ
jgi:predicted DNA-binding transcriptional regulator AlpA